MRNQFNKFKSIILLFTVILVHPIISQENIPYTELGGIKIYNWMYQIQDLDSREDIEALDNSDYQMFVIEPGHNFKDYGYETEFLLQSLKHNNKGSRRLVLAYIDMGQAEDYRTYWNDEWIAPTDSQRGDPDFLISLDPDGWSGNYPVAYWDQRWQEIWLDENGIINQLTDFGFDGVYLDWVEAYDDDSIREIALRKGLETELEMMKFIERIREMGISKNEKFVIIAQNAPYLLDYDPDYYASIIDAIATEDTWYYGMGDAPWDHDKAGDLRGGDRHKDDYSTKNRIKQNLKYLELGLPVFTIDYCISPQKAKITYEKSRSYGFIPLVTRVSLSELTETPSY